MQRTIGALIRELRTARRLSMRHLANRAGISQSTISRWESERFQPSLDELEAVLKVLGVSAAERKQALTLIAAPRAVIRLRQTLGVHRSQVGTGSPPFGGDLLRAMRLRRGWSVKQTAAQINVQAASLRQWERSEHWPSIEKLHALCYVLGAHEEEVIALEGGLHLPSMLDPTETSLDAFEEQYHFLEWQIWNGERVLIDLHLIALEAQLWRLIRHVPPVRPLLARVYAVHGRWLSFQGRLKEGEQYAYRALGLVQNDCPPEPFWFWALHVIAQGAAEGGRQPSPLRGVEVLDNWLPVAMRWPEYEAWLHRHVAEYLSLKGDQEAALARSIRAREVAENTGRKSPIYHSRFDHARILLKAGRLEESLLLLPADTDPLPLQRLLVQLAWAEGELAIGNRIAAYSWLHRARETVETHELWRFEPKVEALEKRL